MEYLYATSAHYHMAHKDLADLEAAPKAILLGIAGIYALLVTAALIHQSIPLVGIVS